MTEIKQIGTVIRINDIEALIIGHQIEEKDGRFVMRYIITMYPNGFMGEGSLGKIPVDCEYELVKEGYLNTTGKLYIEGKQRFFNTSLKYSVKEWDQCLDDINERISNWKENVDG